MYYKHRRIIGVEKMDLTKVSKFLALILRHKPEELGLELDTQGWCNVNELVEAFSNKFNGFTVETLEEIVKTDSKGRYAFNEDKTLIRAVQGHSKKSVNITFEQIDWDNMKNSLYHGTGEKYLESILKDGIVPKSRNYVHLSNDLDTAINVGSRHGKCVVLQIDTDEMRDRGYILYRSENGVYLVNKVPKDCFTVLN